MSEPMPTATVTPTYEMHCPRCDAGYTTEDDPRGSGYQCEVCELVFMPIEETLQSGSTPNG